MRRLKITVGILLAAISITSCSNFLDELPDNRTQINTVKNVKELITLAYPDAAFYKFADLSSDNAFDSGKTQYDDVTNTETFFWDVIRYEAQDTPTHYWNAAYKAVAQANAAIEAGEKMLADREAKGLVKEVNELKGILAEAYLARAYSHFTLVNIYSKAYDPSTADSELGIPYVTEVEDVLLKHYDRGTVASTYDKIEEDLLKGLEWIALKEVEPNLKKYHFNVASGKAFAARFYNYKGEFTESLKYSDIAVDGSSLRNKALDAEDSDQVQKANYAAPAEKANLLISTVVSNLGRGAGARYSFTATVANASGRGLYNQATNPLGKAWIYTNLAYTATDMLYIPKNQETFKVTDPTNQIGTPYTNIVLFSTDMLYMDRIEALINENRLSEALQMLNVFTRSRTKAPTASLTEAKMKEVNKLSSSVIDPYYVSKLDANQKEYLTYLADLRRRETYMEGVRFFDVKRYGIPVTHTSITGEIRSETLVKNDNRTAIQIPVMAIAKGITPNPR
ncbi:MAG: RagB/SusD family nutrient uptake outer membrane protein [Flavobacteriaceae bacterium]|nr:RagB/SusD family nutrient uptake outer membrane protein [Flavobacteriaceae bacterium]